MSQENVEIVRGLVEAFNKTGDREAAYALLDPEIEFEVAWRSGRDAADFHIHRGLDEVRAMIEELMAPFESIRYEVHEYLDAGDDVVAILEFLVQPKGSSAEISTGRFGYVYTLRDGKIVRIQDFPDPAEALEAAGLRE
jgi:ketosteroid isomerase-like protein